MKCATRLAGQAGREGARSVGWGRGEGRGMKRNEIKRNARGALARKSKVEFESIFLNLFPVEAPFGWWGRLGLV